jgi:hypothetical protein
LKKKHNAKVTSAANANPRQPKGASPCNNIETMLSSDRADDLVWEPKVNSEALEPVEKDTGSIC